MDVYHDAPLLHFLRHHVHLDSSSPRQRRRVEMAALAYEYRVPAGATLDHGQIFVQRDEIWHLVPLPEQRPELIRRAHCLAHSSIANTVNALTLQRMWWHGIARDVELVVLSCGICARFAPQRVHEHPARALDIPSLFHRVGMDLVLGLPLTVRGNVGVLVLTEYLSKWVVVFPVVSKEAAVIARHLLTYCTMFGPPHEIISDQGREFVNATVAHLCSALGVNRRVTSPYHPRTDGQVERTNQSVVQILERQAVESPDDWDEFLPLATFAINTRASASTGFTPFELLFGRPANAWANYVRSDHADLSFFESVMARTAELRKLLTSTVPAATSRIESAQRQQRHTQDARAGANLIVAPLDIGAVVYVRALQLVRRKLTPRFSGPYKVVAVAAGGNYHLSTTKGKRLSRSYPIDQLKLIAPHVADRIWMAACSDGVYTVDRILDHRVVSADGLREFRVSWAGFDADFDSWEPESAILDPALITAYFAATPAPPVT